MLLSRTPAALLDQQSSLLRAQLDGVYDGQIEAIHDARVATRRIRELLALAPPLAGAEGDTDVPDTYREVGRALGKVRDTDVQIGLIRDLERHAPHTAPSLVLVRQDHERDRLAKMRRLIKTLERLDVEAMLRHTSVRHPSGARSRLAARGWREHLRRLLVERARTASERISHATGVYFPNRAHNARIGIKKLRYAAEISLETGSSELRKTIKTLRKGQEVLGALHDRAVLADTLARYADRDHVDAEHIALAEQVLDGEVLDLHSGYLSRRRDLQEACAEIARMGGRSSAAAPALAVGGGLLVAGLGYLTRRGTRPVTRLPAIPARIAG
jgi:CHAD domain-containing protein